MCERKKRPPQLESARVAWLKIQAHSRECNPVRMQRALLRCPEPG
jgi:hypothetical protein